jgi:hypothetical protein
MQEMFAHKTAIYKWVRPRRAALFPYIARTRSKRVAKHCDVSGLFVRNRQTLSLTLLFCQFTSIKVQGYKRKITT